MLMINTGRKPLTWMRDTHAVKPGLIFFNGAMVPYADATIHVASVAAKYGANAFESFCVYAGERHQSFIFRVEDHLTRLETSVRLMQIDGEWRDEDYLAAVLRAVRENRIRGDAYVRLTVFITGEGACDGRGPGSLVCEAIPRASASLYDKTVRAAVSTWRRMTDAAMPPRIKAGANYQQHRFGLLEARQNGYDEAIFLTLNGKVSDGANASFAMVRDGVLVMPPVSAAVLESVTRATLLELAADDLGMRVQVRDIDRSELYAADEAFFCGTTTEVRPVVAIDRMPIGDGRIGPVTRRLWEAYEAVVRGRNPARAGWLTPV